MKLAKEDIKKFQSLYLKRFGVELTEKEAYEKGLNLVNLMKVIYKPIKKDDFENYN